MPKLKTIYLTMLCVFVFQLSEAQKYIDYVNPFIGTTNFGATNPGAVVPQGMVSVVPFNVTGSEINKYDKDTRWWSTPYTADNKFLTGFSHVNLSGVGCPDLGVVLIMPTTGNVNANIKQYGSIMSDEKASPGYYSCNLDKYNIKAEVTATQRTGLSRFTFPEGKSNILIDLGNSLTNESGAYIKIVGDKEVEGYRMTGNFCYYGKSERPVYFVVRFSQGASNYGVFKKMPALKAEKDWSNVSGQFKYYDKFQHPVAGDSIGAYFSFDAKEGEKIMAEVGISYVSIENARQNLNAESSSFNFETIRKNAENKWESVLSRIKVEGGTLEQKTVFYTALYHIQLHPNVFNDVNGQYPLMETYGTGVVKERNRYTVFSLWDTYRNFHPLMSLVYPEKQLDMVRSMIDMYKESGWLPKWELNSTETFTMNGDPAFPVITDTYLRGLTDFDVETAYQAMIKSATIPENDNKIRTTNDFYLQHGYVPFTEDYDNSVSIALEYYIADWNLAQLAKALGKKEDYKRFIDQSRGYKNYYDKEFGVLRPKTKEGNFLSYFDPLQGKNFEPVHGFHEGTAWQYTFGAPHDIKGLIKINDGSRKFTQKLQKVFDDGLFDMANEPDMHYPYLFNYVKGEEWRAQKEVGALVDKYFKNSTDGIPGNDDCGTMSAWIVYSMMGLYPVCPGDMDYAIVTPVFDKITIELDKKYYKGNSFVITKTGNADKEIIKTIKVNGEDYPNFFISHDKIVNGGEIEIITR